MGGSHYYYDLQQPCDFVTVRSIFDNLEIHTRNYECVPDYHISCLSAVAVRFGTTLIEYYGQTNPPSLLVDGVIASLPYSSGGVTIANDPYYWSGLTAELPNNVKVTMAPYYFSVKFPYSYFNKTLGLCGTWNNDDTLLINRDGHALTDLELATDFSSFSYSWEVQNSSGDPTLFSIPNPFDGDCHLNPEKRGLVTDPLDDCSNNDLSLAITLCKGIISPDNVACAKKLDVFSIYLNCLSDYCASGDLSYVSNALATVESSCIFAENGLSLDIPTTKPDSKPSRATNLTPFFILAIFSLCFSLFL